MMGVVTLSIRRTETCLTLRSLPWTTMFCRVDEHGLGAGRPTLRSHTSVARVQGLLVPDRPSGWSAALISPPSNEGTGRFSVRQRDDSLLGKVANSDEHDDHFRVIDAEQLPDRQLIAVIHARI